MVIFTRCTVSFGSEVKASFNRPKREYAPWLWTRTQQQVQASPQSLAESQKKQSAYEQQRDQWRSLVGIRLYDR